MSRDVQSMKVGWQQWCLFLCANGLSPHPAGLNSTVYRSFSRRAVPTTIHPKYKLDSPGQVHNDAQCLYLPWDSSCGMAEDWTLLCFCGQFGFPTRSVKGIGWKWLKYLSNGGRSVFWRPWIAAPLNSEMQAAAMSWQPSLVKSLLNAALQNLCESRQLLQLHPRRKSSRSSYLRSLTEWLPHSGYALKT